MASRLEDKLKRLASLAQELPSQSARDQFTKALLGNDNVVISRAARLIARAGDKGLIPALVESFTMLLGMPASDDRECRAKNALMEALDKLEYDGVEPILAALSYRQVERGWDGEYVDTAADLRANCTFMLSRRFYPDIYFAIVPLLIDPEPPPRIAAVTVLGGLGTEAAELLLMMKALLPEDDPTVLHTCCAGLLAAGTDRSWQLVVGYLKSGKPLLAESAAIALGETRDESAFPVLKDAWESHLGLETAGSMALAIALNRTDKAITYLIDVISGIEPGSAKQALQAMSIYSDDERLRDRVREAVTARRDPHLLEAYERAFGGSRTA